MSTTTDPRVALEALADQATRPTAFLLDLGGQLLDNETTWHETHEPGPSIPAKPVTTVSRRA